MAKPKVKPVAATPATTAILVAVGELSGGGVTLASGEELTEAKAKEIGLDGDMVEELVERGKLMSIAVRHAEGGETADSAVLAAALARAEAAEEELADLKAKVAQLEKDLAAAKPQA